MKSFKSYLMESASEYHYRMKMANMPENFDMNRLETFLEKYSVKSVSKPKKTPIQEHPLDFQTLTNADVHIIDFVCEYPTTAYELHNYISYSMNIPESHLVVINKNHPEEMAREEAAKDDNEQEYEPMLDSEFETSEQELVFGDEYNANMLKELESQDTGVEKAEKAQTTNDLPQGEKSPVGSNKANRFEPKTANQMKKGQ